MNVSDNDSLPLEYVGEQLVLQTFFETFILLNFLKMCPSFVSSSVDISGKRERCEKKFKIHFCSLHWSKLYFSLNDQPKIPILNRL